MEELFREDEQKVQCRFKNHQINFGPQHPAAHGVPRLIVDPDGEIVRNVDPHIGFLHRGTEKSIEYKNHNQVLPYFDRSDYVSMMAQELAYSNSVESILNIDVPIRARLIRVIFSEITRISNHLLAITTHASDVGASTSFLWGSEEREKLMEFHERVSGARLHSAYIRPGGVAQDLPIGLCEDMQKSIQQAYVRSDEIVALLSTNRIWLERLVAIGTIDVRRASNAGFSGVLLRGCGIHWDPRSNRPYEIHDKLKSCIPIGESSDCYDRFLVRMEEMYQSLQIIEQCLETLDIGPISNGNSKVTKVPRLLMKTDMEATIHHFKFLSYGFDLIPMDNYSAVEAPKGESGVYLNSKGGNKAFRCKIRSPGSFHLQSLQYLTGDLFLADSVTIIGTLDPVFGEIDR